MSGCPLGYTRSYSGPESPYQSPFRGVNARLERVPC